jgi:undecaprenyl diphosphate synthase
MTFMKIASKLKAIRIKETINWNGTLPTHIAIMMDGNGRWATKKGLPRTAGHFAGMNTMRDTIRVCAGINLDFLTLYAFSTENWKRPTEEVDYILSLVREFVTDSSLQEFNKNNVKVNFIGDISKFSSEIQCFMKNAVSVTHGNNGMTVNFAMNYGGRSEILHAVKVIISKGLEAEDISIDDIENCLYTSNSPSPELIIRTSGEKRLSGFLLWQAANAELWFTDEMWPSFNDYLLYKALYDFQKRKERK